MRTQNSINTDDTVQGAEKLQQFYEFMTYRRKHIYTRMHIQTCMQQKKQPNQSLFTFFINQNSEDLFPNVSIGLSI